MNFNISRPIAVICLAALTLVSCRSLSPTETAFLADQYQLNLAKRRVDLSAIRIGCLDSSRGEALTSARETIMADLGSRTVVARNYTISAATVEGQIARTLLNGDALTVGNRIFFKGSLCQSDIAAGWPSAPVNPYNDLALLGHEVLHVWQWQNRQVTGYSLLKVLGEHLEHGDAVYRYTIVPGKRFLDYRFEQQGQMMQDYIMSRPLAPPHGNAALRRLIMQALDIDQMLAAGSQASVARPR